MTKIVFATGNAHKVEEIRVILSSYPVELYTMRDVGLDLSIVEDGKTFAENAQIKARAVARALPEEWSTAFVLADDSGLEIDALGGEPGVYSARYLGEETPYEKKNEILLKRMEDIAAEKRDARFVCAVAAVLPGGEERLVQETIEGKIGYEPRGENGFGYDPIFYLPDFSCSTAELPPEEKNAISHRGKALRAMADLLF